MIRQRLLDSFDDAVSEVRPAHWWPGRPILWLVNLFLVHWLVAIPLVDVHATSGRTEFAERCQALPVHEGLAATWSTAGCAAGAVVLYDARTHISIF